jgi:hypothetical protein
LIGAQAVAGIERRFLDRPQETDRTRLAEQPLKSDETGLRAADFRRLRVDLKCQEMLHREEHRRAATQQRRLKVTELVNHLISDEDWRGLVHQARRRRSEAKRNSCCSVFPVSSRGDTKRAVNASDPPLARDPAR